MPLEDGPRRVSLRISSRAASRIGSPAASTHVSRSPSPEPKDKGSKRKRTGKAPAKRGESKSSKKKAAGSVAASEGDSDSDVDKSARKVRKDKKAAARKEDSGSESEEEKPNSASAAAKLKKEQMDFVKEAAERFKQKFGEDAVFPLKAGGDKKRKKSAESSPATVKAKKPRVKKEPALAAKGEASCVNGHALQSTNRYAFCISCDKSHYITGFKGASVCTTCYKFDCHMKGASECRFDDDGTHVMEDACEHIKKLGGRSDKNQCSICGTVGDGSGGHELHCTACKDFFCCYSCHSALKTPGELGFVHALKTQYKSTYPVNKSRFDENPKYTFPEVQTFYNHEQVRFFADELKVELDEKKVEMWQMIHDTFHKFHQTPGTYAEILQRKFNKAAHFNAVEADEIKKDFSKWMKELRKGNGRRMQRYTKEYFELTGETIAPYTTPKGDEVVAEEPKKTPPRTKKCPHDGPCSCGLHKRFAGSAAASVAGSTCCSGAPSDNEDEEETSERGRSKKARSTTEKAGGGSAVKAALAAVLAEKEAFNAAASVEKESEEEESEKEEGEEEESKKKKEAEDSEDSD